jgi:hypothetical protein
MSCSSPAVWTTSACSAPSPIDSASSRAYRATAAEWRAVIRSRSASVSIIAVSTPSCTPARRSARLCERSSCASRYWNVTSTTASSESAQKPFLTYT